MKKTKKFKKPNLPGKLPSVQRPSLRRAKDAETRVSEALQTVPRITNETVAEHREEVLSSARKYIYPLQHSKNRVVRISIGLLVAVLLLFFVSCGLALYKSQSTNGFIYGITKVLPFPAARAGHRWVSYESYLFELRRNMHYYQTQQHATFKGKDGKAQLTRLKRQAMDQVILDAYVKQLANDHHVSVSSRQVSDEVAIVRNQNRLGNNDRVFRAVLSEYWGWSVDDFKRELHQQLLQQAVVAKLDTATNARARAAEAQLQRGADFAKVAAQFSDDAATKGSGGQYPAPITPTDRNVAPVVTQALSHLSSGQVSQPINTGYTLEIIKVTDAKPNSIQAAHIQFTYKDIHTYVDPVRAKHPAHQLIHF